jgi:FkbM family methyltransferase
MIPPISQNGETGMVGGKTLLQMFLDYRAYRGCTEFRFRPRLGRRDGLSEVHVASLDGNFSADINLRNGTSDASTFAQIFLENQYNMRRLGRYQEIRRLYDALVSCGTPLILDGGANIGLSTLYFRKNWPQAHIVAVEPEVRNCDMFRTNTKNLSGITLVNGALAAFPGQAAIVNPEAEAWAYRTALVGDPNGGGMQAVSVNDLIAAGEPARPFIAKIDIEGAEFDLFSANTEWIEAFPILIIELHDWLLPKESSSRTFLKAIGGLQRDFLFYGENVFSIDTNLQKFVEAASPPPG